MYSCSSRRYIGRDENDDDIYLFLESFKDAGETSQLTVVKQLVQMIRNLWVKKPMGGKGPFDPTVPIIFSRIVKSKIFKVID